MKFERHLIISGRQRKKNPAGTVNDFASSLGISKDLEGAAQAVLSGSPVDVDIGRFGEQYFTYVAAFPGT